MTYLKTKWLYFWHNHVQKTMGWLAGTLTGLDLAGYAEPMKGLIGAKPYYGVVMTAAAITAVRAHMAKPPIPPVLPPVG